jgi:hypothetical protein
MVEAVVATSARQGLWGNASRTPAAEPRDTRRTRAAGRPGAAGRDGPVFSGYTLGQVDWSLEATRHAAIARQWPLVRHGCERRETLRARVWDGHAYFTARRVAATLVSLVIGVAWGATAGYLGGRIDDWMMRCVDVLYAAAIHVSS